MSNQDEIEAAVAKAVRFLAKHAETVVVIVTIPNADGDGNTALYKQGAGNYYAQYGSVKHWVLDHERGETDPPPAPDKGDDWKE